MTAPAKHIWVVSDGRRGIENQALGLAEAIARVQPYNIHTHRLSASKAFAAMTPKVQLSLRGDPRHYGLNMPYADIVIGCGRQAIAPLISLKRKAGHGVTTVYIQDPRIDTSAFDFVVAPEHDRLRNSNVISMIGSPNRISNDLIITETLKFSDKLANLPMSRLAMLIGGPSKTHKFSKKNHETHLSAARFALDSGWSVMISTSRRTPDWVVKSYTDLGKNNDNVWLYTGDGPNPYFAFLGGAEIIFVTEDSTNMLTEACTTGKAVFRLPMDGDPGKFQILYNALKIRCQVRLYDPDLDPIEYESLTETDRVAKTILARIKH